MISTVLVNARGFRATRHAIADGLENTCAVNHRAFLPLTAPQS